MFFLFYFRMDILKHQFIPTELLLTYEKPCVLFDLLDNNVRCVHCFMLQVILKSVLRDKLELLPLAIFHGMLYFFAGSSNMYEHY